MILGALIQHTESGIRLSMRVCCLPNFQAGSGQNSRIEGSRRALSVEARRIRTISLSRRRLSLSAQRADGAPFRLGAGDPDHLHAGIGRVLLPALIDACAAAGYRQMIGYIDASNAPSIGLHTACGFRQVGYLPLVAYKFGQWTDLVMVQRSLGSGGTTAPDVWPAMPADDDRPLTSNEP